MAICELPLARVDVKRLGNIPIGGGWRFLGRAQWRRTGWQPTRAGARPRTWTAHRPCLRPQPSSRSRRVVYAKIHDNERADTAIGVLCRAVSWFADHGVTVERVLSDSNSAYPPSKTSSVPMGQYPMDPPGSGSGIFSIRVSLILFRLL